MAPTPPLPVTEDTPPDMLAGAMDLRVVLPGGRAVKMSVERCTPMMDLLVQVATANKMAPGGFVLQPVGERGALPYKPSTPIGALDTWTVQIVPKARSQAPTPNAGAAPHRRPAPLKPNNQQPFEQTFRLQVHLPRNQLFVARVSPKCLLSDVLSLACTEKNLDPNKYELRHPANLEERLRLECSLADYKLQEVTLVAKGNRPLGSGLSSSDIMALQKEEEKRRQQVKANGTGSAVLGLMLGKRSQSSVGEGSISSDSLGGRSISPSRSDETPSPPGSSLPPPRPIRKRRPAPKPPTQAPAPAPVSTPVPASTLSPAAAQPTGAVISHSRNSSDSSGYHEASILSESPESNGLSSPSGTLPRRSKLTTTTTATAQVKNGSANHALSRSLSNLNNVTNGDAHKNGSAVNPMRKNGHSASTNSLAGHGKRKKAPPPPPLLTQNGAPEQLKADQRTSSLSTLSSQSSSDSYDRDICLRNGTLERPSSSQSSTNSSLIRHETLPEEEPALESNHSSPKMSNQKRQNSLEPPEEWQSEILPDPVPVSKSKPSPQEENAQGNNNMETRSESSSEVSSAESTPVKHSAVPVPLSPKVEIRTNHEVMVPKAVEPQPVASVGIPADVPYYDRTARPLGSPRASLPDVVSDLQKETDEMQREFESVANELQASILAEEAKKSVSELNLSSPKVEAASPSPSPSLTDWEYQLPAPPSEFRDNVSSAFTPSETVDLAETPVFEEAPPEVLPPAEFIDADKSTNVEDEDKPSLSPLIQNYAKGITKLNPLYNDEQYEAEILEESRRNSNDTNSNEINKNEIETSLNKISKEDEDDWSPQQLAETVDIKASRDSKAQNQVIRKQSFNSENTQANHLKNFSITSYQRPQDTDIIFKGESELEKNEFEFKKPADLPVYNRYRGSTNSLVSSNLPRTNSFSAKDNQLSEHPSVKRSTSHISAVKTGRTFRAKSIGNLALESSAERRDSRSSEGEDDSAQQDRGLRKTTSEANISQGFERSSRLAELQDQFLQWQEQLLLQTQPDIPLQSLQVLRSILSPSQDGARTKAKEKKLSEDSVAKNNTLPTQTEERELGVAPDPTPEPPPKPEVVAVRRQSSSAASPVNAAKRYSYQGPPAVNFATWSERPKSQVSIKVDNDYRIGKGQGSSPNKDGQQIMEIETDFKEKEQNDSLDQVDATPNTVSVPEGVVPPSNPIKPTPLTMRIISHSTPMGYKRSNSVSVSSVNKVEVVKPNVEKEPVVPHPVLTRAHSYTPAHVADPSRVPIVRAVELKKSFVQAQQHSAIPERKTTSVKLSWNEKSNQNGPKIITNGVHKEDEDVPEVFQGVNQLAKRFSLASSGSENLRMNRPLTRPTSAYFTNDSKEKFDFENKRNSVNMNGTKEMNDTNVVKSNASNNQSSAKKYTSVVGINGAGVQNGHQDQGDTNRLPVKMASSAYPKPNGVPGPRHPMPVVKGFRFATNDYSDASLVAADSHKSSTNSQPLTVKIQQNNNSSVTVNQRNASAELSPGVSVRIQLQPTNKPSPAKVSVLPPVPPPAPPTLPKKTVTSRPKSLPPPATNPRDQLMDAIRDFERANLRQNGGS